MRVASAAVFGRVAGWRRSMTVGVNVACPLAVSCPLAILSWCRRRGVGSLVFLRARSMRAVAHQALAIQE